MNCKLLKFFGIIILLFFFNTWCYAQNNNENETDSSGGAVMSLDSANIYSDNIGDTVITKTIFDGSGDSILKWKRSREFGYMAYLDSLLKKKKNNLRIDTINIDKGSGSTKGRTISASSASSGTFLNSFPVKIFFWLLAIFFIGFILYRLFLKGGLFAKGAIKRESQPAPEEPEKLSEYSEYIGLIHEAELKNDFNLAVRYLYLQSLKKLSDEELILFSPDKTNRLYVEELTGKSYQTQFASLTLNYEYVWYGKFAINLIRYERVKEEFNLFNRKL